MADRDHLILTATGPDQLGLVEKIAEFISGHRCNIDDSKMAVFCGEFATIILIGGSPEDLGRLASDCRQIEKETGLTVLTKIPSDKKPVEFYLPYKLRASCMDHPGIVYHISAVLSGLGVNIESMETKTYSAPVSGTPLFQMEADLAVPARANINQLRERLEELQREENIDVELHSV